MLPLIIGHELCDRRHALGLSQRQVGQSIHRTRAYVSALERGVDWDPDADVLTMLADVLRWPPDHILRRLERSPLRVEVTPQVSPELLAAISLIVRAELRSALGPDAAWRSMS